MNNFLEYFYGIKIDKIIYKDQYYSFMYNGHIYKLYTYDNSININFLVDINKKMVGNTLVSEIITNRNNEVISIYNNVSYILIKIYVNTDKSISLEEVSYLANSIYKENISVNYGFLWGRKIDYL